MAPSTESGNAGQHQQEEVDTSLIPSYTDHNGFRMPKGFPVDGFISGLQYQAQPNDLFVATYPKCGTTWMQHLVYLILHDGEPVAPGERLTHFFPHLEEVGAEFVQQEAKVVATTAGNQSWRLIKTHLPYEMTPQNAQAKYIFVARNPKDCVVSFFHHTRGFVKHYNFANGSFDTFFDLFLNGQVDFGDYFHCLRSWMDHRNDKNVLFVTYEALRANLRSGILQVAEFLDADYYPDRLLANDEVILKAVMAHSSLDEMKKDPARWSSERPKEHAPFIRKGSVGDWDELLTPKQAKQLDQRIKETCSAKELNFLGPHYCDGEE